MQYHECKMWNGMNSMSCQCVNTGRQTELCRGSITKLSAAVKILCVSMSENVMVSVPVVFVSYAN